MTNTMLIYFSGGDSGWSQNPEAQLPPRQGHGTNIMLSYHHMTKAGAFKYRSRFRRILTTRGHHDEETSTVLFGSRKPGETGGGAGG